MKLLDPDKEAKKYSSQKEHWRKWLLEYGGAGFYGRKIRKYDARFVYNHIVCPPMLLWLCETIGVSRGKIRAAMRTALSGERSLPAMSASIRRAFPWESVEQRLTDPRGTSMGSKILHLTLHRKYFAAIAAGTKKTEYRRATAYWQTRLQGRRYDIIKFRNGYRPDSPEMLVEYRGIRLIGRGQNAEYAIRLGRIRQIARWHG